MSPHDDEWPVKIGVCVYLGEREVYSRCIMM